MSANDGYRSDTVAILVYLASPDLAEAAVTKWEEHLTVVKVYSRRQLSATLVTRRRFSGVVIIADDVRGSAAFIDALVKAFPVLPLMVIARRLGELPDRVEAIRLPNEEEGDAREELATLHTRVTAMQNENQRKHHRVDWPITGTLLGADADSSVPCRVSSVSASGAYLQGIPQWMESGARGTIAIRFGDFSVMSSYRVERIIDGNERGAGIRFIDMTPASQRLIERIVNDEIVKLLVHPGSETTPPNILV